MIGSSRGIRAVLERVARVAPTNLPVLIEGESGTGKELLARCIHATSPRIAGPFIAVNCAAIPRDLLESELFGHERGAFTGAHAAKEGAFERAHGGTLFLDEIGDMAVEHQAKVLRAIQEHEVQRVGGDAPRRVDVRIVAATHRKLATDLTFRTDLYYRLAGYMLSLPPLRERGRDIIAIAKAILGQEFPTKQLSRSAQACLVAYSWPGNIRELQNVIRAAAIDARGRRIDDRVILQQPGLAAANLAVTSTSRLEGRLATVHAVIETCGKVTAADVRALFDLQKAHAYRLLAEWERAGALVRCGSGRATHYVVAGPCSQPDARRALAS